MRGGIESFREDEDDAAVAASYPRARKSACLREHDDAVGAGYVAFHEILITPCVSLFILLRFAYPPAEKNHIENGQGKDWGCILPCRSCLLSNTLPHQLRHLLLPPA